MELTQKTIVITGASSGIGLAAASALAGLGARVIGVGRSRERCEEARQKILAQTPGARIEFALADLSAQRAVLGLAAELRERLAGAALDVLVNNAGQVASWYTPTVDGYELQFAVNHLATFLLTHELLPALQAAPAGRVLTTSSGSHRHTRMHWNDVMLRRGYNPLSAYSQSKMANVLFTAEFNRREGASGPRAYAIDPGLVNTNIGMKGTGGLVSWIWSLRARGGQPPEVGAATIVHLASQERLEDPLAIYWKDSRPLAPDLYALREDEAARLWALSERLCGLRWPPEPEG
ncbi:SDR family NAD(P)-dependent oxidoreductase [bacterium]|nr:MAG: SDR family NAD(P)-dependent oxidoreductase [bacterium]